MDLMKTADLLEATVRKEVTKELFDGMHVNDVERLDYLSHFVDKLRKFAATEDQEAFYRDYESRYDYSMDIYDRGFSLSSFCTEYKSHAVYGPAIVELRSGDRPKHISELPLIIRYAYCDYLDEEIKDLYCVDYHIYTEEDALFDYNNQ